MHISFLSLSTLVLLTSTAATAQIAPRHVKPPGFVRVDIAKRLESLNKTFSLGNLGEALSPSAKEDMGVLRLQARTTNDGDSEVGLEKRRKHKKKGCKNKHKSTHVTHAKAAPVVAVAAVQIATTSTTSTTSTTPTTSTTSTTSTTAIPSTSEAPARPPTTSEAPTTSETSASSPTPTYTSPTAVVAAAKVSPTSSTSVAFSGTKGLVSFSSSNCGSSGANADQPNGSQDFLNCGINGGGWNPPAGVTLDNIAYVSLEEALRVNSVWEPCKQYVPLFEKYGNELGIPPILLASFALQESTCNANIFGDNGGAIGLMQITSEKCGGLSHKDCAAPEYNIATGAKYFKSELDKAGGNLLKALGTYNGWFPGMTYGIATAKMYSDCCVCQQNLDYLYQMVNGWVLGKTGYSMGSIGNLKKCY